MDDAGFEALCAIWQTERPPRVWSVLVTLFGDIAQEPDVVLSGAVVNAVLGGIGIKPEAIRVALHRLRHDGWLQSTKVGRTSNYALTEWGREACATANPLIYGPWQTGRDLWLVATQPGEEMPLDEGLFPIASDLWLSISDISDDTTLVVPLTTGTPVPAWVSRAVLPSETMAAAQAFHRRLTQFSAADVSGCSAVQTVILRTLIVHEWRRIVLKVPALPDAVMPAEWCALACRSKVTAVLENLPKPDIWTLSAT